MVHIFKLKVRKFQQSIDFSLKVKFDDVLSVPTEVFPCIHSISDFSKGLNNTRQRDPITFVGNLSNIHSISMNTQ